MSRFSGPNSGLQAFSYYSTIEDPMLSKVNWVTIIQGNLFTPVLGTLVQL